MTSLTESLINSIMRIISIIQDQIINAFLKDLKDSNFSKNSIKFYKSDVSSFISWIKSEINKNGVFIENFKDSLPFIKTSFADNYKKDLLSKETPTATINRKLSAVRKFSSYIHTKNLLSFDFAKNLENITLSGSIKKVDFSLISEEFKKHLEINKASKNTIKNYIADINHFLNWLNSHNATA